MESLFTEIKSVKADHLRLSTLEKRVPDLHVELENLKRRDCLLHQKMITVMKQYWKRWKIDRLGQKIYKLDNVEESQSTEFQQRIAHDCDIAKNIFTTINVNPRIFKASRIGKSRANVNRPLRVSFNNTEIVREYLVKRKKTLRDPNINTT